MKTGSGSSESIERMRGIDWGEGYQGIRGEGYQGIRVSGCQGIRVSGYHEGSKARRSRESSDRVAWERREKREERVTTR